jgi:hypothetical protein
MHMREGHVWFVRIFRPRKVVYSTLSMTFFLHGGGGGGGFTQKKAGEI